MIYSIVEVNEEPWSFSSSPFLEGGGRPCPPKEVREEYEFRWSWGIWEGVVAGGDVAGGIVGGQSPAPLPRLEEANKRSQRSLPGIQIQLKLKLMSAL
jgi:hypothetical protein